MKKKNLNNKRKILGDQGEDLALKNLQEKGYQFIGRNIKLFCGEIDLLFQDGETLVIVEVKTKSDESFGQAAEMITYKKKKKLLQLAKTLWQKYPNMTIRIDVVAIDHNDEIDHLVSAVQDD